MFFTKAGREAGQLLFATEVKIGGLGGALGEKYIWEKSVGEKYMVDPSLGEKYMGEKYVQEEFLGEESLG